MTVEMDSTSDDHSPPLSDHAGSTWLNWETEISSISGLNIDSSTELNGLVEDKEVAARAVAFVVNSTRKGIVPLCADIANLLRAKRSLEKKVYLLKREVEALRSSASVSFRTSHSTSPTQPLTDKVLAADINCVQLQERSRPCSRCSQCSSTVSNSPKLESTFSFKSYLSSPSISRDALRRTSPRLARQISQLPPNGTILHCSAQTSPEMNNHRSSSARRHGSDQTEALGRNNSLPEITGQPDNKVMKVSSKVSKETQCYLTTASESPLEEQFIETVRLNSKLAEDLGSARKEIEVLKGRLKELEMNRLAKESTQKFYKQDSDPPEPRSVDKGNEYTVATPDTPKKLETDHQKPGRKNGSVVMSAPTGGHLYPEPLHGCKCTACEEAMGGDIYDTLSMSLNEDLHKFPVNSKVVVQLGDHVVIRGEKTGRIRYIGHLDKIGQPNMLFVGLELDAPVGNHDGFFNNKRYFFCQKDHGIFVAFHDIICQVPSKVASIDGDSQFTTTDNFASNAKPTCNNSSDVKTSAKMADDIIALVGLPLKPNSRKHQSKNIRNLEDSIMCSRTSSVKIDEIRCAEDLV